MDKFQVVLLSQAKKFYKKCPLDLAKKLNICFEALEQNPFYGPQIKQLKTKKKLYRYRLGAYRIRYEIDKKAKKVGVLLISSRSSAYRDI